MGKTNKTTCLVTIIGLLITAALLGSCGSSRKINNDYLYFRNGGDTVNSPQKDILLQPDDLLNIRVSSKTLNQEQAAIFNLPNTANGIAPGYQINSAGNIEMPMLGSVKAAGLTINQLQAQLTQKLAEYVKNPSVVVHFLNFNVNVLGEVRQPGVKNFSADKVTLIDALSMAGDLTDNGKREDVTVVREANGKKIYHTIDLRNRSLFESPVYLLEPNDIVYVGPNKNKLKSLSVDPEAQRRTGMFFSVLSIVVSIASIVIFSLK